MKKFLASFIAIACLSLISFSQIKLTYVNPANNQIKIKNFGTTSVDVTNYRFCALFEYINLSQPAVSIVTGDFALSGGEEVTIAWNSSSGFNTTASDLGLFLPTGGFNVASAMVDFMQYGAAGQGREGVANTAGLWTSGTFLTGAGPWYYIGNGSASGINQWSVNPPTNDVTFRVDMSQQTVSGNGVHIAGDFQSWNPGSTALTDANLDGVYEYTAAISTGSTIQFKYLNGNAWGTQESVPTTCGVSDGNGGFNRTLSVTEDIVLDVVCFGLCTACPVIADPVSVTFKVNMQNQVVSPNGVHVAGSFQGWNAGSSEMTDANADGIYEFTALIAQSSTIQYKFINGNSFSNEETVPAACGVDNGFGGYNRSLDIADADITLTPVCFGECADCEVIVEPLTVDVTFRVNMQNETVSVDGVHIAGSFQGFDASTTEMTDLNADGIYEVTVAIDTNSTVYYTFINGNTFGGQEAVPATCGVDNGFGGYNRSADILEANATLATVCFGECADCEVIVEPLTVDVTFRVNMQNETVSANGVHIAGSFQGFDPATTEMTDLNADGIYEVTVAIDTNSTVYYTFINGNTFGGQEAVPAVCGQDNGFGGYNRTADVLEADLTLASVCFGECADCEVIVEPLTVDVTFRVNMQNETVSANGVHIAGSFQGFDPATTEMTDLNADGIYEVTVAIDTNSTVYYTFINGNTFGGQEAVPATCGVDNGFGGYNRSADILEANATLATVCFGECADCEVIVEPLTVDVTFRVNMQNETVSANGVHIAGSFQGFDPASTEMTDLNADGIYEVTVAIDTNSTVTYTFINGNTFGGQEAVPAVCGQDNGFGGYNRTADVLEVDLTLATVCFGECADCEVIVEPLTVDVTFRVNMQNETVSANGVHIAGSFQGFDPATTEMTDLNADGIYEVTVAIDTNSTVYYTFINGNTFGGQEAVPAICGVDNGFGGYNRSADILEANATLATVCFGECADCEVIVEPLTVDVTFRVNMQNETVSANGVHIAGSFQGFDPATTEMTDIDADGTYEVTVAIDTNSTVTYTFINGNTFGGQESVPALCGQDNGFGGYNRTADVLEADLTLATVCFGECADCEVIVEPLTVDVTFRVNMQNETVSANGVHLAGSFQGFDPAATAMTDIDADGIYEVTVAIDTNSTVTYTFINGNTFGGQETVPAACGVDNGFGGYNRSENIGESNTILDLVCFSECVDCENVVVPLTVDVTFSVNMQNETVSPDGVHIAGNFQGWDAGATELTDIDADGIYEVTVAIDTNSTILYTYINGNTYAGQEAVPAECGVGNGFGGYNRTAEVLENDLTIAVVCFGECANCETVVVPTFVDVTFNVNMQNEVVAAEGVKLKIFDGFNDFLYNMTDDNADNVYSYTAAVDTNSTVYYLFANGDGGFSSLETAYYLCTSDDGPQSELRYVDVMETNMTLDTVCFSLCNNCPPANDPEFVDVTFSVNMSSETVSPDGVTIIGRFVDGINSQFPMTDLNGDNVYEVTLEVDANQTILYAFVNGLTFLEEEEVPVGCQMIGQIGEVRRFINTTNTDLILPTVCFSSCNECGVQPTNQITFLVNMQNETVSPNGVHIAGNFQGWDPAATEMLDENGDGVYTVTITSDEWANLSFKFINGNTWGDSEVVPSTCGLPDGSGGYNRILETGGVDVNFGPVCFGECSNCEGSVMMVDVTFKVNMQNETVSADGVHLAGNIQGWDPATTLMTDDDADGIYEVTLSMESGSIAEFRFINGNDWPFSEVVPSQCGVPNGFGQNNRSYLAGVVDGTFGPVCFNACVDCDDIVEPTFVDLTFKVNMANEAVSADGVHVAGSFQGVNWDPAAALMTDDDLDGIYEYTTQVPANSDVLFKFINGNAWPAQESVPAECGANDGFGGYNRSITIGDADQTFGPVCFSECVDCLPFTPVIIVFRVDMSNQTVSPDGVFIAGTFNGWNETATEMSEYEPNHYQAVVVLNQNEAVEYKFLNGPVWTGSEVVPAACGVADGSGGYNRSYQAGTEAETLPLVCFSECAGCVVIPMVDITFRVDMSQQTVNAGGVYLAGSFNGFSANATPMTLQASSVYTATVTVPENTQITFKYLNGPDFAGVESVPFECGVEDGFGGFNRTLTVDAVDVTLPEVCFSSCVDCPINVDELSASSFEIYPNPTTSNFFIRLSNTGIDQVMIYDATGRFIQNEKVNGRGLVEINASSWSSGLYQVVIPGVGAQSVVVE